MFVVGWLFQRPAAWEEPSTEKSFPGLFLGGISWVFSETHKLWASILRFDRRRLTNSYENEKELSRSKVGCVESDANNCLHPPPLTNGVSVQIYL
jgi:hypothetical protein